MFKVHSSPVSPFEQFRSGMTGTLLSDISPIDSKWDEAKALADEIANLFAGTKYDSYSRRIKACALVLAFALQIAGDDEELLLKLVSAAFCRCPGCPVCQVSRARMWRAKTFQLMPLLLKDYPWAKFLFLTLTVENPHITDLRATLLHMNKSWARMCDLVDFPAEGFIKTTEVTREYRCISQSICKASGVKKPCSRCIPTDNAHPHFHCLVMVRPGYFGKNYLKHADWVSLWQRSLRVSYSPMVNIKVIKDKPGTEGKNHSSVLETFKYAVKLQDVLTRKDDPSFMNDQTYLVNLIDQIYKLKLISTGGILKTYFKEVEREPENLIYSGLSDDDGETIRRLASVWNEYTNHYQMLEQEFT